MTDLPLADLNEALGITLTPKQWDVVSAPLEPAVVIAGAGTGKTTSMAARVAWLIASGHIAPDAIMGLTFTNKAASGLLASIRRSLGMLERAGLIPEFEGDAEVAGEPQVLTYNAFAKRIIDEHGMRLGREPNSGLITDGPRHQLAYRVVCRTSLPLAPFGRSPIVWTQDLLDLDDQLADLAITPETLISFEEGAIADLLAHNSLQLTGEAMLATSRLRAVLAGLVLEWRAEKQARDLIDYSDQTRLALELVTAFPDIGGLVRERIGVVLLDEYQDTSLAQRMLLQALFGQGHPVTAVGDPCQAIYGFRGASVDNIYSFTEHFPRVHQGRETDSASYPLTENRRSGPTILQAANAFARGLRELNPGANPLEGGTNLLGPGFIRCGLFDTAIEEREWIVGAVADLGVKAAWGDIAILAATGRELAGIDSSLRAVGIPTQLHGAAGLLRQPAVVDVRSMLEILHDPCSNPAMVRVLSGPRWRIGVRDLAALGRRAVALAGGGHRGQTLDVTDALDEAVAGSDPVEVVSLSDALNDLGDPQAYSEQGRLRFAEFAAEITALRRHGGEAMVDLIHRVVRTTGLMVEVAISEAAEQQQYALTSLLELASDFNDIDGGHSLGAFLSRLRDAERFDVELPLDVVPQPHAVQLLTIHKAKGLEFAHVFVPAVAKGAFPSGKARGEWPKSATSVPWALRVDATEDLASFPLDGQTPSKKSFDEYMTTLRQVQATDDERLVYVAMTRAKMSLTVTGHWWGQTQTKYRGPEAFLTSMRHMCATVGPELGEVVMWADEPDSGSVNPSPEAGVVSYPWPAPIAAESVLRRTAEQVLAIIAEPVPQPGVHVPESALTEAEQRRIDRWDSDAAALLQEARRHLEPIRTIHLPDSVSASTYLDVLRDPAGVAERLARPMPRPPAPAARRGTSFHLWVESRYGQQTLLDPDDLPGSGDEGIPSDQTLAELKAAFEKSPYAGRQPVAVEEPFSLILDGRVIKGRIDAVFEAGGRFEVVDWKTGSAASADPEQLALYRQAWSQLRGVPLDQIDAAFVIVQTGEVIRQG